MVQKQRDRGPQNQSTYFEKFRPDPVSKEIHDQEEKSVYIHDLMGQIAEKKQRDEKLKMKERMEELAAEEKYLQQLKSIEQDALEENEKKFQLAREVEEE